MGFNWKPFRDGDRFKFNEVGDGIAGTITKISTTDFGGQGDTTPVLFIKVQTGEELSVAAGNVMLCSALAEIAPEEGDWISMKYIADGEKKGNRSAPKLFEVDVKRNGNGATAAAAPPPPPPTAAAPPPPAAALPAVPGYPPPTPAQMADPAYVAWYQANLPKTPPPPPPPPAFDPADEPF